MLYSSLATRIVWTPGSSRSSRSAAHWPSGSCQKAIRRFSNHRSRCGRTVATSLIGCFKAGDLLQRGAELWVVCLHAVIKIDSELARRQRVQNVVLVLLELQQHL